MTVTKKFAVIQRGTVMFGIGDSREAAINDSISNLEFEEEDGFKRPCRTAGDVESMLSTDRVDGALAIIDSNDEEWSDYVTE